MDNELHTISQKGKLIGKDVLATARMVLIAVLPTVALMFLQGLQGIDFGSYTPVIGLALSAIIDLIRRKYATQIYIQQNS